MCFICEKRKQACITPAQPNLEAVGKPRPCSLAIGELWSIVIGSDTAVCLYYIRTNQGLIPQSLILNTS